MTDITLSVVSHGQGILVFDLLQDLAKNCTKTKLDVILTLNVSEELPASLSLLPYQVLVLRNTVPLGFGENHNRALRLAKTPIFCVINPDVRLEADIFATLIDIVMEPSCGVVAPLIVNGSGAIEDSTRKFPTPFTILCKALGGCWGPDYQIGKGPLEPDWVAGMFMVIRRDTYESVGGFDEKFFLYYEDVDLCARIRSNGLRIVMTPTVSAVHKARRSSHRSLRHAFFHIRSMARFFTSKVFVKMIWFRFR